MQILSTSRTIAKWMSLVTLLVALVVWPWSATRRCGYWGSRYNVGLSRGIIYFIRDPLYRKPFEDEGSFLDTGMRQDFGLRAPTVSVNRIHVGEEDNIESPKGDGTDQIVLSIRLPLWTLVIAIAILTGWFWYCDRKRIVTGRCPKCGYNLLGNEALRCPECGAQAVSAPPPPPDP